MPPRREVGAVDRQALLEAVETERVSREAWEMSRTVLEDAIRVAVGNGASLRAVAELVDLSHGRIRDIVKQMPLETDEYYVIANDET